MNIIEIISKKRAGLRLDGEEVKWVVRGFVQGYIPDYQMSALLMAISIKGMDSDETVALTREMLESGCVFDFSGSREPVIDKHSTGGVGDKISLILLPIAIECGLRVPMISGRALGFTGGTLDKLESIPCLRTDLSPQRFEEMVGEFGGCFGAQTEELVPADKKIYALRDATATVECIPLIVASILSKKIAEGIGGVVIDVKCGAGAFIRRTDDALRLARALEEVGGEFGVRVSTVLTSMEQPLGHAVGNALEVAEAISTLQDHGPTDCIRLTHRLVSEMLLLGGIVGTRIEGKKRSIEALSSGRALDLFLKIIEAQGGVIDMKEPYFGLPKAPVVKKWLSPKSGHYDFMHPRLAGEVVRELGGGRLAVSDEIDPSVGLVIHKKKGEPVERGEPVFEVHAGSDIAAQRAVHRIEEGLVISDGPVWPHYLFL
jgi:pyrimidine-nucleoside phosphorylase